MHKIIDEQIKTHPIILYMKGDIESPLCGFSAGACKILEKCGVLNQVYTINILEDEELKLAMKSYSSWPTFPQLYINQEFIGGYDIMKEMYAAGELQDKLFEFTKK